tara:strand:- start:173 stop:478 length:306 start_codon:yes stop_codon:yes gene_type:complete
MSKRRYLKVQDCFEFQCPERWSNLKKTDEKGVKHCSVCDRNVHKASNKEQLLQFGKEGKCAAYYESEGIIMGEVVTSINNESFFKGLADLKSLKINNGDQN